MTETTRTTSPTQPIAPSAPKIDEFTPFATVLSNPGAVQDVQRTAPQVLRSPLLENLSGAPTGPLLTLVLGEDDARITTLLERLSRYDDDTLRSPSEDPIKPTTDYEPEGVRRASPHIVHPATSPQNQPLELWISGPSHSNPFVDVEITADFTQGDLTFSVGGFYDGDGRYGIRFLPPLPGQWEFTVESNARSIDGLAGSLDIRPSSAPGPVRVVEQFHFAHADGTTFTPYGTTAYAWIHQSAQLQDDTVATLAHAPFNKVRMCLFPKDYLYNTNEPERFVFQRGATQAWDTTRFDPTFFANLERRIGQLAQIGVQAEIILFHPYDRWGFSRLTEAAEARYLTYAVRRLAGFPNVWWSMANEYDLLAKRPGSWEQLAAIVQREDHVGHPLSIHNWVRVYDHSAPWVTHVSLQRGDYDIGKKVDQWRARWAKPVVIDEFGYEGDLDQGWGNLMAEEVVRRFWEATLRGAYLTHGETYFDDDDLIWWSKGGALRGQSPDRIAFLREVVSASPTSRIEPLVSSFDDIRGGVEDKYVLIYFGAARPRFRTVQIPEGMTAQIDIIDTWDMTITQVPGTHTGTVRIDLPARPYIALRLQSPHRPPA
jgi:hypothetical protein